MADRLDGRAVVVTGAAAGIGRATALALAAAGATVVAVDRDADALEALRTALPPVSLLLEADATAPEDVARCMAQVEQAFGAPTGLVNNVGGSFAYTPFAELTLDEFDRTLALNLRATFLWSRAAVDLMLTSGGGRIVNVASIAAERAIPSISAYSIAKAGVLAMTRSMAVELAQHSILVNAVVPGHILTPAARAVVPEAIRAGRDAIVPTGAHGAPEDVARAVTFLLADATYMTGAELHVDGGLHAAMPRPPAA